MMNLDRPAIITIHGFNVKDGGAATTDKIANALADKGLVVQLDYGFTFLLGVRVANIHTAKKLQDLIDLHHSEGRKVVVIGHSNGCAVMHVASLKRPPEKQADLYIYVNPALENNLAPAEGVKKVVVYFSPSDKATTLAKKESSVANVVNWFLPKQYQGSRPWGDMGTVGYIGDDARMVNLNEETMYRSVKRVARRIDHSGVFEPEVFPIFKDALVKSIEEGIKG